MKTDIRTVGFGVVLRMHEPCGLDAAQRQFYRAIAALVIAWWLLVPLYVVVGRALWRVMWS